MYDIQKIMKCLPHRYPFLLVDRVLEIDEQHRHAHSLRNGTAGAARHWDAVGCVPSARTFQVTAQPGGCCEYPRPRCPLREAAAETFDRAAQWSAVYQAKDSRS